MSTIGSCTGTPYAICRPVDWAGMPLGMRATSKLVPPMSQEITSSIPASAASSAAPTVPAAGPENSAHGLLGCTVDLHQPPARLHNPYVVGEVFLGEAPTHLTKILRHAGLHERVDCRRRRAFVFPHLGCQVARDAQMDVRQGVTQHLGEYVLVHGVGVAVEQAHAHCLDIELLESTDDAPHAVHVELRDDPAVRTEPLTQLDAAAAGDQRAVSPRKSVGLRSIAPAKLEHILKSGGSDECHPRALAFEDGIGRYRRAVYHSRNLSHGLHDLAEPSQKAIGLVTSREHFRRPYRTGFSVVHGYVSESTADVDTSNEAHCVCLS